MARRSRIEILLDILELLKQESLKKTAIMYRCNLSWATIDEALDVLVERGLISKGNPNIRLYEITEKGKKILDMHSTLRKGLFK